MVDRLIGLAHRKGLADGVDVMARAELEHVGGGRRAAQGGAGDGLLPHHQREGPDLEWLEDGTDKVEVTAGPEGPEIGLPVELHVGRHQDEVERAGNASQLGVVGAALGVVRTEMLGLSRQGLYAKLHRFGIGDLIRDD